MQSDYVIVGTGSAGSVVANRLSADPSVRITVLEAGPLDTNKFVHIPATFAVKLFRSEVDWDYSSTQQKWLNGRQIYFPRGKVVGGSSSMNAMMWVPGFSADYDEWGALAGDDWDFAHVSRYFERIEKGPLVLSPQRSPRRVTAAWLTAAQQCGYALDEPGYAARESFYQTLVTQRRGARWSCADAYLRPALRRRNLTLLTEATATRVVFNGTRAVGVEFERHGQRHIVRAGREVVLCGGAINSPQLLMLSGIGDYEQLAEHGVDVVRHVPEVGKNLTDHLYAPIAFEADGGTLFGADRPWQLIDYLVRRRGMLTSNGGEAYGFVRSRPELALPDLEMLLLSAPYLDEGLADPHPGHGLIFGPVLLRPQSRGAVSLRSSDPHDKPVIDPRYLTDDAGADREAMLAGLRITARLAEAPALKGLLRGLLRPREATQLDEDTLERALESCAQTTHHPVGTCRMGRDSASVVDPQLRVRGVHGLRVADASVMPAINRGHTHAPTVLIGEKASDLIQS